MTDPIAPTSAAALSPPPSAPQSATSLDKDTFLKLLVAQLKYQNPMSPSDPQQWMAQTAQFTMVEKLDMLAKSNAEVGQWQRAMSATLMVGQEVTATGPDGAQIKDFVTGMKITSSGALLELERGGTIDITKVETVRPAPRPAAAPNPATSPTTPAAPAAPVAPAAEAPAPSTPEPTPATDEVPTT